MRQLISFAIFLLFSQPAFSNEPFVQNTEFGYVFGGSGGGAFKLDCPNKGVATGMNVRSGGWIEAIGLICRQWDQARQGWIGAETSTSMAGGPGGSPLSARCKEGSVIIGMKIGFTREDKHPKFLDYVQIDCGTPWGTATNVNCIGTGDGCNDRRANDKGVKLVYNFAAPAEHAGPLVRLIGRSGVFVDSLGFVRATDGRR